MARDASSKRRRKGRSGSQSSGGSGDFRSSNVGSKSTVESVTSKKSRRERAVERRRAIKPGSPSKSQAGVQKERSGGFIRFVGSCAAELRKVDWPGQKQLIAATVAVLIAVAVVGVFLYAADEALSRLVRDVLLSG